MTEEEKRLWYGFLSKYPIRVQRQKPIDIFIADFYCYKAKLIIEVDGSQHSTKKGRENDEARTKKLEEYGIKIIRVSNQQIRDNFDGVCKYLDEVITESM